MEVVRSGCPLGTLAPPGTRTGRQTEAASRSFPKQACPAAPLRQSSPMSTRAPSGCSRCKSPARCFTDCRIWSPDAARLACDSFGGPDPDHQTDPSLNGIYSIRSSDGGDLTRITSNPGGEDSPCDYSPDGINLAWVSTHPDGSSELDTVNLSTGVVQQLVPAGTTLIDFECGSWSPDGDQTLFAAR